MARKIGTKQQPKLTYCAELRRYELRCRFEDRGLAKRFSFAWDPEARCWHTDKNSRAAALLRFADEEATNRIKFYMTP